MTTGFTLVNDILPRLTGLSLTVDEVQESVQVRASTETQSQASVNTQTEAPHASSEPRALSFAEIKELIEQGKTDQIPNNRVIPDELSVRRPLTSSPRTWLEQLAYRHRRLANPPFLCVRSHGRHSANAVCTTCTA